MMRIAYSAASLVFILSLTVLTLSHEVTTARTGKLKGSVFDSQGAVVVTPRPTIIIKSAGTGAINRITPNEDGKYEIDLPVGIYQISTDVPGFYPFRRALFQIQPAETVMINLVPSARYFVRGTTVSPTQAIDKPAPRPRYDTFSVPQSSSQLLNLVIQFQKKRIFDRTSEYQNAILSYNELTICADKLALERKTLRVKASGNQVLVEDGSQRSQPNYAEVNFKGGKPVLNLIK
jgi:hypothetical protein